MLDCHNVVVALSSLPASRNANVRVISSLDNSTNRFRPILSLSIRVVRGLPLDEEDALLHG